MAKKLIINAAVCDLRKVREETLAAYEHIDVNAAAVLVNEEARTLIARYGVSLNCGSAVDVEGAVKVRAVNGRAEITAADGPEENLYLMVNGSLHIAPGAEEALRRYVGILVNGSVSCPRSLLGKLGALQVNGSTDCYPDGALPLKRTAVIDHLFLLRARAALYWAARRMILVDPQLDGKALAEKGVRFSTREAIIAQPLAEAAVPLFDTDTDIQVVPGGTAVVQDDLTLDAAALRRYGGKLYIIGDLTLTEESRALLPQVAYLHVTGDVYLPAALAEPFAALGAEYGALQVIKGRIVGDKAALTVSRSLLEGEAGGLTVRDCALVKVARDVPPALILQKLSIRDCAAVHCTPEQEEAVALIAQNVASIGEAGEEEGLAGLLKGTLGGDTKVINAMEYVL